VADASVPRLELREWAERFGLVAGITTRGHGFSLGLWSAESVGQVMTRWRALRAAVQRPFPSIVLSHQVHGTDVRWHDAPAEGWMILDGVDGHATARPGVLLTVTVADCIPIYLAAPDKGAIALLHAGWRGTAARILERGVELLRRQAFVKASDLVMHCGVGICGECYEVGSEVATVLSVEPAQGPVRLDLRALLVAQARELGIGAITTSLWCTAHDHDTFFSHRASGGGDGRQVAYLGSPLA
jgi:purine-nucleoside/S-methyl-5'-thioadenosine phosphorylase / adenosine deaminase